MTPMLPITLVSAYLKHLSPRIVLDPYAGVGTTLVEAQSLGINSIGIDANPFMCLVSAVKTARYEPKEIASEWSRILENSSCASPPAIPKIKEYYDDRVLNELLRLKGGILKVKPRPIRNLFLVALSYLSVKLANVLMSPAPRFVHKHYEPNEVVLQFSLYVDRVIQDCVNYEPKYHVESRVIKGDSRILDLDDKIDCVITSPPYCNNLDYVRHTQLELYWTDLAESWKELTPIRKTCITSCEAMVYEGKDSSFRDSQVSEIASRIRQRTKRALPQVVMQYFAGIFQHLNSVSSALTPRGTAMYVIGDSWIKDVHIPSHQIIARLAATSGFRSIKISYLRPRRDPYRRNLAEYVLIMSKSKV